MKYQPSKAMTPLSCSASHPEARMCSRCKGTGNTNYVVVHLGVHGLCYKCDGTGYVGGAQVEAKRLAPILAARLKEGQERRSYYEAAVTELMLTAVGLPLVRFYSTDLCAQRATRNYESLLAGRKNYAVVRDRLALITAA